MDDLDMTAAEVAEWVAFERVNGPMLTHERLEGTFAVLCSLIANSQGRETEPADFLPYRERPEQSPEQMIATLKSVLRSK